MSHPELIHLHLHSEYSLLDGFCRFDALFEKLKKMEMKSVALTDHGNLFGAVDFFKKARAAGIKPIIGCEFYVAHGSRFERKSQEKKSSNHLVLLAKNYPGYLNLAKLSSIAFLEGFYYKPRIDMEVLREFSEGLLCTSACLSGEIPRALIHENRRGAEEIAKH